MAQKSVNNFPLSSKATLADSEPIARQMLTAQELAAFLRVNRSTVYRLLKRRDLPGFRIGSEWRFDAAEINQWFKQRGGGGS
jgi:excisionase family DNA binding protein